MLPHELPGGCLLHGFEERDAEELDRVVAANRAYLARWLPWVEAEQGVESRREFIRSAR
jgi:hypothetical protein